MTTSTQATSRLAGATTFLESLHQRIANDNGSKAAFKRALSGEGRHIRQTYPIVLDYVDHLPDWMKDIWILVACLSVYYPQPLEVDSTNFGQSCRALAHATQSDGAERRFRALLETDLVDIRSPLAALVRQMKGKAIAIHYPHMIVDLCAWDHPDQYIQDRWARTFWGVSEEHLSLGEV